MALLRAFAALGLFGLLGCSGIPRAKAPEYDTGQAKCRVAGGDQNPLVTEWAATDKANLERKVLDGAVAVRFSGCDLQIIEGCALGGGYRWQRTTPATDGFEIRSEDDLFAKLPVGAMSLKGALAQSGSLKMTTTVAGQLRLGGATTPAGAACSAATHVVTGMSVGAFRLDAGDALGVRASADTPVGEIGVGTKSSDAITRRAGDPSACSEATDQAPHAMCASPIQLFLVPIEQLAKSAAAAPAIPIEPIGTPDTAPGPITGPAPVPTADVVPELPEPAPLTPAPEPWLQAAPETGSIGVGATYGKSRPRPEDMVMIRLRSTEPDAQFHLKVGPGIACSSPCEATIAVDEIVAVENADGGTPMKVRALRSHAAGVLEAYAEPDSTSELVGGIVLTSVGGAALIAGTATILAGPETAHDVVGGVLLALGAGAVVPGVIFIVSSRQTLDLRRSNEPLQLSVGPGRLGLNGAF
jgi:hypothetical protein